MIVEEIIEDGKFKRTYSDQGYQIQKVGTDEVYDEAVDLVSSQWTYSETSERVILEEDMILEDLKHLLQIS